MPPVLLRATGVVVGAALFFIGVAVGGGNASHILALAGTLAACGALGQFYVARQRHEKQTEFDLKRHEEQTKSDFQRRITENFTKAVEQLASDKLVSRIGGIYALERISKESPGDYRIVMETLTAFVRDRVNPVASFSQTGQKVKQNPATDVAAVLIVIRRRSHESRRIEQQEKWSLDLSGSDLRGANLIDMHLQGCILSSAHLEGAYLDNAHLEGAYLDKAHLEEASLWGADLKGAQLWDADLKGVIAWNAHLEGANLWGADLKGANFYKAHLGGADLSEAHLEGADLKNAFGLKKDQLDAAHGDKMTILPQGFVHPPHWPP